MKTKGFARLLACAIFAIVATTSTAAYAAPVRLTDNDYDDTLPAAGRSSIVWMAKVGGADDEIMYFDGTTVRQLTDNDYEDFNPRMSGNQVVWEATPDNLDREIFMSDGSRVIRLTDNDQQDESPDIDQGLVTWQHKDDAAGGLDWEVWVSDGVDTAALTDNGVDDLAPRIAGADVVWHAWDGHDFEIMGRDGTRTVQVTDNLVDDMFPDLSQSLVAWQTWETDEPDIAVFDGTTTKLITNDINMDGPPEVDGKRVTWEKGKLTDPSGPFPSDLRQVMLYDGAGVRMLTDPNGVAGHYPHVSGDVVAWTAGNKYEAVGVFNGISGSIRRRMGSRDGNAQVAGRLLVWQALVGDDWEIFVDEIDVTRPTPQAPRSTTSRRGATARLYFRIADAPSTRGSVTIAVKDSRGRTVKRLTVGSAPMNSLRYASFKVALARGRYSFHVSAKDAWGNTSARAARNTLTVR